MNLQNDMSGSTAAGLAILVVEDEVLISMLLEDMLGDSGCTVVGPCVTVGSAMTAVENDRFDAALVDLSLSDGTSEPVIEALVAKSIPFAVMSGQSGLEIDPEAAEKLSKPFTYDQLVRVLEALAGRCRDGK